jgi:hypothetical protein
MTPEELAIHRELAMLRAAGEEASARHGRRGAKRGDLRRARHHLDVRWAKYLETRGGKAT